MNWRSESACYELEAEPWGPGPAPGPGRVVAVTVAFDLECELRKARVGPGL